MVIFYTNYNTRSSYTTYETPSGVFASNHVNGKIVLSIEASPEHWNIKDDYFLCLYARIMIPAIGRKRSKIETIKKDLETELGSTFPTLL